MTKSHRTKQTHKFYVRNSMRIECEVDAVYERTVWSIDKVQMNWIMIFRRI